MKRLVERKEIKFVGMEIELPFYASIEENEFTTIYVKVEENKFTIINWGPVDITISSYKSTFHYLSQIWFENKCPKGEYVKAVNKLKEFISSF